MATRFASEKRAIALCDRCGFRYPLKKLKTYVVLGKTVNQRVCPTCWEPDNIRNWVGIIGAQKAADDPQALRNPRPDTNLNDSRGLFGWNPAGSQQVSTAINNVKIEVS